MASCGMGRPRRLTSTCVGMSRPSSIRIVVVLPEPFGPRKPNTDPVGTCNERSSTTATPLKRFTRRSVSMANAMASRAGIAASRAAGVTAPMAMRPSSRKATLHECRREQPRGS